MGKMLRAAGRKRGKQTKTVILNFNFIIFSEAR